MTTRQKTKDPSLQASDKTCIPADLHSLPVDSRHTDYLLRTCGLQAYPSGHCLVREAPAPPSINNPANHYSALDRHPSLSDCAAQHNVSERRHSESLKEEIRNDSRYTLRQLAHYGDRHLDPYRWHALVVRRWLQQEQPAYANLHTGPFHRLGACASMGVLYAHPLPSRAN